MIPTKNRVFFAICPFCSEGYPNCQESFRNQNVVCTKCYKAFKLVEFLSDTEKQTLARQMKELMATVGKQHTDFNKEMKKTESKLQDKHPSSSLQNDVIPCTEKLQLKDQKKDIIAELQKDKKVLQKNMKILQICITNK